LQDVVPPDAHWASLEVNYSDRHNGLAAAMVSTSQDGAHSLRSVLNWVEASTREGWYWRVDADHNTLLGILNSDTEEARVQVSLDYSVGGVQHSYDLPERVLAPRASELVDVGAILATAEPDAEGDRVPAEVTYGGYRVRKVGPCVDVNVTTEALIFDRKRKDYLTIYNTGCCDEPMWIDPDSFAGLVGEAFQLWVFAGNACTGEDIDYTDRAAKRSANSSVATVSSSGVVQLVGAGTTKVTAILAHMVADPFGGCYRLGESRDAAVTSKPRIDSIAPARGLIGASTMVTIQGRGFVDGSTTVSAGTGITVTLNSVSETQIVATFDVSTTAPAGNHSVTATRNGQTSNSVNFFVQVPTSLSGPAMGAKVTYSGTELRDCFDQPVTPVFYGYSRCPDYVVLDQASVRIDAAMVIREDVTVQATNVGLTSHTGDGATDSTGLFKDFLAFGNSTTGPQPGDFAINRQILSVAIGAQSFTVRVNCMNYQATDVTVTDRTSSGVNVNCTQ